jgi:hypothetical protein
MIFHEQTGRATCCLCGKDSTYVLLFGLRTWILSHIMQLQLDIIPKVRKEEYVGDITISDFARISLTENKIKSAASI